MTAWRDHTSPMWRQHRIALARILRAPDPQLPDTVWRLVGSRGRNPPAFNNWPRTGGRRPCPLCGQDAGFKRGWWHVECVSLWHVAHAQHRAREAFPREGVCALTGEPFKTFDYAIEFDHIAPLYAVKAALRADAKTHWRRAWWFWSVFNLRPLSPTAHKLVTAQQARDRAAGKRPQLELFDARVSA